MAAFKINEDNDALSVTYRMTYFYDQFPKSYPTDNLEKRVHNQQTLGPPNINLRGDNAIRRQDEVPARNPRFFCQMPHKTYLKKFVPKARPQPRASTNPLMNPRNLRTVLAASPCTKAQPVSIRSSSGRKAGKACRKTRGESTSGGK